MSSGVTENLACRERGERAKGITLLNQKNMDVWVKGHGISALSWKQENMDKKKGTKNDLRIAFCFFFVHMLLHDRFKESPSQLWQLVSHMSYYIR